jgi:hypothetical protein
MELLFFLLVVLLVAFLIVIIYYNNKKKFESFSDINGSMPIISGSQSYWSKGPMLNEFQKSEEINTNCSYGTTCIDKQSQFGIYNDKCICISQFNKNKQKNEKNEKNEKNNKIQQPSVKISPKTISLKMLDKDCYPNNSNFEKICKIENIKNGVEKIIPCDNNHSKVECKLNYINGIFYGENVNRTPCLNKSDDFDNWCRYYNNVSTIPSGYNVNSIGLKKILVGSMGGCYTNNGKSDNNKAIGICDYNYIEQVTKLEPANKEINYNVYTNCLPLNNNNFIKNCRNLMKSDLSSVTQIMGYDCNPGYGRAKCLRKPIKIPVHNPKTLKQK